jgi:hypothetical protein
MSAIWESLGYVDSPLFCDPLSLAEESQGMFVGRRDEVVRLLASFARKNYGVVPIGGSPGAGKTTFLNHVQYLMASGQSPRYLEGTQFRDVVPSSSMIELDTTDSPSAVLRKALRCICQSISTYCTSRNKRVPATVANTLAPLSPGRSGGRNIGLGANLAGYGGTLSYGQSVSAQTGFLDDHASLSASLRAVVKQAVEDLELSGIVCVIDNTELVTDEFLSQTMSLLRDSAFSIRGLWWVVVGRPGLAGMLTDRNARLRGYLTRGIDLGRLPPDDFMRMLRCRENRLAVRDYQQLPISAQIIKFTYATSLGDIRMTLDFLDTAVTDFIGHFGRPPGTGYEEWIGIAQAQVSRALNDLQADRSDLFELVERMLDAAVSTVARGDFRRFDFADADEFETALDELAARGYLWKARGARNEWNYQPKGYLEMERTFRDPSSH